MQTRKMKQVEFPMAQSKEEIVNCLKDGGTAWKEAEQEEDFPKCVQFTDINNVDEYITAEFFEDNCIHLIPKGEEDKEAEPFKVGELVFAMEDMTHPTIPNEFIFSGNCYKITGIETDGEIKLFRDNRTDISWDATKFCRCS